MATAPTSTVTFGTRFASELGELAVPWRAAETPDPRLLVLNEPLAARLGFDPEWLRSAAGVGLLTGTVVPDGATPVAQGYAGHQFGGYSPLLGDGRALLLGEVVDRDDALLDVHLKGSGRTPFARGGDGLAVVGPMLREYVISEAMHALGIPTTRSLAVVATGRPVLREQGPLPGAVLTRVAASHLRVGTFQLVRSADDRALMQRLVDHAIARHHPRAEGAVGLLDAVIAAQASLVARWMLVGFVHGVMNTDNMTISGETIDYGPCAFMEGYDPATVYSSIDTQGRYAYGNQPIVAEWNLARLAEALLPLIDDDEDAAVERAKASLGAFRAHYAKAFLGGMKEKLGLPEGLADDVALPLVQDLLEAMREERADHTTFYRKLASGTEIMPWLGDWHARWRALDPDRARMARVNPLYIPRNHLVEEALAAATGGDLVPLERLLEAVSRPFDERPGLERFTEPAPQDFGAYRTYCGT
ncbi:UPF0061 protein [Virgisporangium aliadipatigenens]|uniref:Protein nucleotidyltransferase YdiU n=1 Tax=Virgisporangium aliadipatigenens TaxID=741659 RepID=A0A8J3YTC4_9ACTN|nr:YdiU family protein [Virgisporangium aliadipatigenens]GIJ50252.1 UPF0061 protein [Virgisporangium aliadipatigenens]